MGNVSTIVYDVLNHRLQSTDARGGIVTLAYDPNNNLLNLTDPVGNQTQWVYDALNRKVQETDPLFNIGTFAFDGADRMTSSTDKIGQRIAYAYDLLNRETGETWYNASGTAVNNLTFTFDANSNLLTQSWPVAGVSKTASMTWDALDRLSTQSDAFATVLTNSYDAASNLLVFQDSFGGLTTRLYDVLNRVATMSYTGQSIALREDFHYTARDQVAGQIRFGNLAGTSTVGYSTFSYDGVGRVTNLLHSNGSGANIANYTNTYDLASRITSEVLNAGSPTTYQYDSTDQLINDSVVSYSYDLNGNRTMTGYTTGPANELTSDGTWNYAYDKNGNLIQKTNISTGEVFAFGYDIRNRMVTATDTTISSSQMQATYGYDALNQRIQKNVEMGGVATITEFAYYNGQIWVDMNSSNALQTRYLRTDQVLESLAQVSSAGTATWMLADRMGSLRNVVNSTGVVINTTTYDGFGNITNGSNSTNGDTYKYAGYRYDSEVRLLLADTSVRSYDPNTGRFKQTDPIGMKSGDSNLFRYCGNNVTNTIDPSGLEEFIPAETDFEFRFALSSILGYRPSVDSDEFAIGNQGCVGVSQLALGIKATGRMPPRPHLASGARCFRFEDKPENLKYGHIQGLKAELAPKMNCSKGQELRVFIVQFWQYADPATVKDLKPEKSLNKKWTEFDPRTISTTSPPAKEGQASFDFATLFTFDSMPDRAFWLHMNHGRIFKHPSKAVMERSTLAEVMKQYFDQMNVVCLICGSPSIWYEYMGEGEYQVVYPPPL